MITATKRIGLSLLIWFISIMAAAAVPTWKIIPAESNLSFTATQNGAPVSGEFKQFSGDISFDPDQLAASHITIVIDMNSIFDSYQQLQDILKSKDWFDTALFPKAIFKSTEIIKLGDKKYQAKGNLTLRDKTLAIVLNFTQEEYSATKARMKGEATLNRSAFGVGQGEWADTTTIKDEVQVNFVVSADRINSH